MTHKLFAHAVLVLAVAAALIALSSCHRKDPAREPVPEISGYIVEVNGYGQPIPDFTPAQMAQAGFDYADLLDVTIGEEIVLNNLPYVSSFNEVAILGPSYVDYNARGDDYGFAMLNGDFHYFIGGEVGDRVTMKLSKKGGYLETYDLMRSVYPMERRAGETAEQYANFRMVTTAGVAPGVLYRSGNPLNCEKNPGRYSVADSLAEVVGIRTEIDLADTPEKVEKCIASEGYGASYCPALYAAGSVIACGMNANGFCDDFKQRLGEAVKFMIEHEPPYLIHCNEGKDRCGFVTMIFEALCGASVEELRRDYMVTMLNYYQIPDGGESYMLRQSLSIDRMIWLICNEEVLEDFLKIDWSAIDVSDIDWDGLGFYKTQLQGATLQAAAEGYLRECGLANAQISLLRRILTGGR